MTRRTSNAPLPPPYPRVPRPLRFALRLATFSLLTVLVASAAWADVVWVGFGPGCDTDDPHQALAMASSGDSIRWTVGSYQLDAPLLLPGHSGTLTIDGGWGTCGGVKTGTTQVVGDPDGSAGMLRVTSSTGGRLVLRDLELRDGRGAGDHGGALTIEGDVRVVLRRVTVRDGEAMDGGAAQIRDGATLELVDSHLWSNRALSDGGALWCLDAAIVASGATDLVGNRAEQSGGAVRADGCSMTWHSGPLVELQSNTAHLGGGVLQADASTLEWIGDGDPFEVFDNGSKFTGVMATEETSATWINVYARGNTSEGGEAVAKLFASTLVIRRDPLRCLGSDCSKIEAHLGSSELIELAYSTLEVDGLWIEGNATTGVGIYFYAESPEQSLRVRNVLVSGNQMSSLLGIAGNGFGTFGQILASFEHVTTADNALDAVASIDVPPSTIDFQLHNSIFADGEGFDLGFEPTVSCIVYNGTGDAPPEIILVDDVGDIAFVDPAHGDFRLRPISPAVDACAPRPGMDATTADLDGGRRVYDSGLGDIDLGNLRSKVAAAPLADAGAYEFGAPHLLVVFADDFDDGSLDAWSSTFPEPQPPPPPPPPPPCLNGCGS